MNIFPQDNKKRSYIAATAVLMMCFVNIGVLGSSFFWKGSHLNQCREQSDKLIAMMKESLAFQGQQVETIKKMKEAADVQAATIQRLRAEVAATQRKQ